MRDTAIIRNSISKLDSEIEMTQKRLDRAQLSQVTEKRKTKNWKLFFFFFFRMKSKIKLTDRPLLLMKKIVIEMIYLREMVHKHYLKRFFMTIEYVSKNFFLLI